MLLSHNDELFLTGASNETLFRGSPLITRTLIIFHDTQRLFTIPSLHFSRNPTKFFTPVPQMKAQAAYGAFSSCN